MGNRSRHSDSNDLSRPWTLVEPSDARGRPNRRSPSGTPTRTKESSQATSGGNSARCRALPRRSDLWGVSAPIERGELHRVAIAQALSCRPDVVIADEPTQSLDATRQAEILDVLREVNRKFGCAIIFITHNPALLAGFADRVIVMYAGRIVEEGPVPQVFRQPLHPYTKGLLQLVPASLQDPDRTRGQHLPALPGSLSHSDRSTRGCIFESRCFARTELCQSESPREVVPEEGRRVSCFNYEN